jgi:hypothetical protein
LISLINTASSGRFHRVGNFIVGESAFWDLWHKTGDAFAVVYDDGSRRASEVRFWDPGRSKRPIKVTKSSQQKHSLMCSLRHENNTVTNNGGIDVTSPVNGKLEVAEMENGRY